MKIFLSAIESGETDKIYENIKMLYNLISFYYTNNFKNAYYYKEGIFIIQINGTQAKAFAKKNNIEIERI